MSMDGRYVTKSQGWRCDECPGMGGMSQIRENTNNAFFTRLAFFSAKKPVFFYTCILALISHVAYFINNIRADFLPLFSTKSNPYFITQRFAQQCFAHR